MIHIVFSSVFSSKVTKVLLLLAVLCFVLSLFHRYIQQDEPWFGEQAYWLLNDGQVKLKSMPGVFDWTNNMVVFHKLFVWIGAGLIWLCGWHLTAFKLFILITYITSAYFLWRYLGKALKKESAIGVLGVLLFIITPELVHRGFMFRPEVPIMMLGFLSFYCLYKHIVDGVENTYLAGILSGLAFLMHLNAVIFPVTGFFFLLINKRWKGLVIFTLVGGSVCAFYSLGMWDAEVIDQFLYEMKHWPTHQKAFGDKVNGSFLGLVWNYLLRILNEHKRYFWDQDVWGISALFILSLLLKFKHLWREYRHFMQYTLLLMFFLSLLSSGHSSRYLVYIMPFMTIVITLTIFSFLKAPGSLAWAKTLFLLVFLAQLYFCGTAYADILKKNYSHVAVHAQYLSKIPKGSNVLAPWEFIYNNIDDYQLHSFKTYEYIEDQKNIKLSQMDVFRLASEEYKIQYIIIDRKRKTDKSFPWFNGWDIKPNSFYHEMYKDDQFVILTSIRESR